MAEEAVTPSPGNSTETTSEIVAPSDFREYVTWRKTGEMPAKTEETPPVAAEETPPAKSAPPSGAEDNEQEDEVPEATETVEAKPARPGSRQRKIDRLTRENEMLRQQLVEAMQPKPPQRAAEAVPAKPPEPTGKPKLQDFKTLEEYQEALTDWKLDQREAQRRVEAAQAEARAQAEKIQAGWSTYEQTARSAHPDYDEVLQSVQAPAGPGVMAARQAMLEDESGPEILYYLGTHPEELQRIAGLQPVSAVKEIGKLAAALTPSASPPAPNGKPKVSSAPKPPAPLSRPSGQTVRDDIHDPVVAQDFTRWNRARLAQLKGK